MFVLLAILELSALVKSSSSETTSFGGETRVLTNDQVIPIAANNRSLFWLSSGVTVELQVNVYPMIVVIPQKINLDITVYSSNARLIGSFNDTTEDFGVYFNSTVGSMRILALGDALLEYYAFPGFSECSWLYLSTSKLERFIGSGSNSSYSRGNFTIGHNQNVCFYHISNSSILISGDYNTEQCCDSLLMKGNDWSSYQTLAGTSKFSVDRTYYSGFQWRSDHSVLSGGFSVTFNSTHSTLPVRRTQVFSAANVQILSNVQSSVTPTLPNPITLRSRTPSRSRTTLPSSTTSDVNQVIDISSVNHKSWYLTSGMVIELEVNVRSMIVVIPQSRYFTVAVTSSSNARVLQLYGSQGDFGVYFGSATGVIRVTCLTSSTFEYYAFPANTSCDTFIVSTVPTDIFVGFGSDYGFYPSNFTLDNNQNICIYHVSDSSTTLSGRLNTEQNYDYIEVYSSEFSSSIKYSGLSTFSTSRSYYAGLRWHSDSSVQSGGFRVVFTSNSLLPNYRGQFSITDGFPVIVTNCTIILPSYPITTFPNVPVTTFPNAPVTYMPFPSGPSVHTSSTPILAIIVVAVIVILIICVISAIIYCCWRRRQQRRAQDQDQVQEELNNIPPLFPGTVAPVGTGYFPIQACQPTVPNQSGAVQFSAAPYFPAQVGQPAFAYPPGVVYQTPQVVQMPGYPVYFPVVSTPYPQGDPSLSPYSPPVEKDAPR